MKTTAICVLALAGIFAVVLCGGAAAVPYKPNKPTDCHMVPGKCVTKTTVCPPLPPHPNPNATHGPGQCVPKTYQQCAPAKKVCD